MEETFATSIEKGLKSGFQAGFIEGFSKVESTLVDTLKIQSYNLEKVVNANMHCVSKVSTEILPKNEDVTDSLFQLDTYTNPIKTDTSASHHDKSHSYDNKSSQESDEDSYRSKKKTSYCSGFQNQARHSSNSRHNSPPNHHHNSDWSTRKPLFGMNAFSLAANERIKFNDIINYMDKVTLPSDSAKSMKEFYSSITLAVNVGFQEYNLKFLPSFDELNSDIDFEEIFLGDIRGTESMISINVVDQSSVNMNYNMVRNA